MQSLQNFFNAWSALPFKDRLSILGSPAAWISAMGSVIIGFFAISIAQSNKQIAEDAAVFARYDSVRRTLLEFNRNSFRDEIKRGGSCIVALSALESKQLKELFSTGDDSHSLPFAFMSVPFPATALRDLKLCAGLSNDDVFDRAKIDVVKFHSQDELAALGIKMSLDEVFGRISNDLIAYLNQWETLFFYWLPPKSRDVLPRRLQQFDGNQLIERQFGNICHDEFPDRKVFLEGIRPNSILRKGEPELDKFLTNCPDKQE